MIGFQVASQMRVAPLASEASTSTESQGTNATTNTSHLEEVSPSPSPSPTPSASPMSLLAANCQTGDDQHQSAPPHQESATNFSMNTATSTTNTSTTTTSNSTKMIKREPLDLLGHRETDVSQQLNLSAQVRSFSAAHQSSMVNMEKLNPTHAQTAQHMLPLHSPGYHSAASSPCSPADSPVSSSSAGSSGVSSASSTQGPAVRQQQQQQVGQQVVAPYLLLDHFPETNGDGLRLSWAHETNSRAKLGAALMANTMIVSGDISLAESTRYPVPIMARPPLGASDLLLENWLHEVTQAQPQRGIKLTFTSTRTVEPAFRVLARHAAALRGPLILSADILTRAPVAASPPGASRSSKSQQQQQQVAGAAPAASQPVDAWTFLMMCRTRFPKCTISIGWCAASCAETQARDELAGPPAEPSMFDLDLMDAHPALSQLMQAGVGVSHLGHLQHLSHQQNRPHHTLHPYPLGPTHQLHHHRGHPGGCPRGQHASGKGGAHLGHHMSSSAGSLSGGSSSGNSSGSPSPTSPVSQLVMTNSPPYQSGATNLSLGAGHRLDSATKRLLLSACKQRDQRTGGTGVSGAASGDSAAAAAAAAAVTAALMAASSIQHQQQMPLNLNINEAADHRLGAGTNASAHLRNQQHFPADSLAGRLFNPPAGPPKRPDHALRYPVSPMARASADSQLLLRQAGTPPRSRAAGGGYTRDMVDRMAALVKEYNLSQPVTFPVLAVGVLRDESLAELQRLLYQVGASSSLTVVAQADDLISVDDLLLIRRSFGAGQLLFDLPEHLAAALRRECD